MKDINKSYSYSDVCRKNDLPINGSSFKKIKKYIKENNINIDHFNKGKANIRYERVIKKCPSCGNEFETLKGHPREKITCGYSCSNSFFRSGNNHPNWKETNSNYRDICFSAHEKKCVVCAERNIVAVHHYDGDHENNEIENLIPLCPTHHQYIHSKYKHLIEKQVEKYREAFKSPIT